MRTVLLITTAIFLTACSTTSDTSNAISGVMTNQARATAKTTINSVVAQKFPGVNVAPVSDCIIDNASTSEIFSIAGGTMSGTSGSAVNTILNIAKRPETITCITNKGFGLLSV